MKRLLVITHFILLITLNISVKAESKNDDTYLYLELFQKVFSKFRSTYVEEVSDKE